MNLSYSDLANVDPNICPSSPDYPHAPASADNAHRWDTDTEPVTCAECGAVKE